MPISSLPNEVLANIFEWGVVIWSTAHRHSRPFPQLICSICTHWRTLSVATPELWNRIIVPLSQPEVDVVKWTATWLERSKACLLDIVIDLPNHFSHVEAITVDIEQILSLVTENVCRLRLLEMTAGSAIYDSERLMGPILALKSAPTLKELQLYFQGREVVTLERLGGTEIIRDLAKLSTVKLGGVNWPFPLSGLTSLTIQSLQANFRDICAFFEASPSLETLVLVRLRSSPHPNPNHVHLIDIPSLRSLAVSFDQSSAQDQIFYTQYLSMPNLTYLELSGDFNPLSAFGPSLLTSTKIHTLRVSKLPNLGFHRQSTTWEVHPSIRFLHSLSSVQHLQLIRAPASFFLSKGSPNHQIRQRRRSITLRKASPSATNLRRLIPNELGGTSRDGSEFNPVDFWHNLITISIDSLVAEDLACLCEFVSGRKGIQTIRVSTSAKRHICGSLRRVGEYTFIVASPRSGWEVEGEKDVYSWMSKRVNIEDLGTYQFGYIE